MPSMRRFVLPLFCIATIAVLLAFGYLQTVRMKREIDRAAKPVKDLSQYHELLAKVRADGLANHFPGVLPPTAIAFNYTPHFLQGPLALQLKCQISDDEFDAALERISACLSEATKAVRAIDPKAPQPYDLTESAGVPQKLPSCFEVHMIYAVDQGKDSFPWNHGTYEGIAIDREHMIILYFAQSW